jgi:TPR repeat protein
MRTLIALMLFATTPVAAGAWEDGAAAYRAGDYHKAVRLWKPLAGQGDVRAQAQLGGMYLTGKGVPKDDFKAVHWFTKAAKQGHAGAQFRLGLMYYLGGDYVRAYAWFTNSAIQRHVGEMMQEIVARRMTLTQLSEAAGLSIELFKKYVFPFQEK